jgi:hypothetical protein
MMVLLAETCSKFLQNQNCFYNKNSCVWVVFRPTIVFVVL